jgi:8-oxo-dGTP diphosphatase
MNSPRVGVATIIKNEENKILLGYRKSNLGTNTWAPPGGKLDMCEELKDCATRELKEETNLTTTADNLKLIGVTNNIFNKEIHYITIYYIVDAYVGKLKLMEPDKCEKWEWYDYNDLPIDLFLPFKNLIKDYKIFDLNE